MEKSESTKQRRADKARLKVTGRLAMPREILTWERDLLAVLIEAVNDSAQQEEKGDAEGAS